MDQGMDPILFKAASTGVDDVSHHNLNQKTPNDDNILHVAAAFKQLKVFNNVSNQSPLFWATNKDGNTPLHVAAGVGCHQIVEFLIEQAKEADQERGPVDEDAHKALLRQTNRRMDTALHVAVRNGHSEVVVLLVEADPELCCFTNSANESPLFIAVENGFPSISCYILEQPYILHSFDGINGFTALHAAVAAFWRVC